MSSELLRMWHRWMSRNLNEQSRKVVMACIALVVLASGANYLFILHRENEQLRKDMLSLRIPPAEQLPSSPPSLHLVLDFSRMPSQVPAVEDVKNADVGSEQGEVSKDGKPWICINLLTPGRELLDVFGSPYDVFSSQPIPLLIGGCSGSVLHIKAGRGSPLQYIYPVAYLWTGTEWKEVFLEGDRNDGGWYIGQAWASLRQDTPSLGQDTFFVGYICTWISDEWKCGCRDRSCDDQFWQLQGVRWH